MSTLDPQRTRKYIYLFLIYEDFFGRNIGTCNTVTFELELKDGANQV